MNKILHNKFPKLYVNDLNIWSKLKEEVYKFDKRIYDLFESIQ